MAWKTRLSSWQQHLGTLEGMAGFADVPGTENYRLLSKRYGVSKVQELQKWPGIIPMWSPLMETLMMLRQMAKHMFNIISEKELAAISCSFHQLTLEYRSGPTDCLLCLCPPLQLVKTGEIVAGDELTSPCRRETLEISGALRQTNPVLLELVVDLCFKWQHVLTGTSLKLVFMTSSEFLKYH